MARICNDRSGFPDLMNVRHQLFRKMDYPIRDEQVNQVAILWASVGNTMPGKIHMSCKADYFPLNYVCVSYILDYVVHFTLSRSHGSRDEGATRHSGGKGKLLLCCDINLISCGYSLRMHEVLC